MRQKSFNWEYYCWLTQVDRFNGGKTVVWLLTKKIFRTFYEFQSDIYFMKIAAPSIEVFPTYYIILPKPAL